MKISPIAIQRTVRFLLVALSLLLFPPHAPAARDGDLDVTLEQIRSKHELPALAAAVVVDDEPVAVGAVGVRKDGSEVPVTVDDKFHIGSCTKAITATLIAQLIEEGKLREDVPLGQALPALADAMHADYRGVTLTQLLAHRGGLPSSAQSWPKGMNFLSVHGIAGTPREQRYTYAEKMLSQAPVAPPGSEFVYSNAGYSVAAVIAEEAMDESWEDLLRERIFKPLGMTSAGFGAMGTPGEIDQPWQHRVVRGAKTPIEPGPLSDNPPALGPAGTVHCSIGDWARFVGAHLAGARGRATLLQPATFEKLHTAAFGGEYANGWLVTERPWAGGKVMTHAGSNNMSFAVVWMAPLKDFAVVVATNQGGAAATKACDEVAGEMIRRFLLER